MSHSARLWCLDREGQLAVVRVQTGLSDGQMTEIQGEGLETGMRIIMGTTQNGSPSTGATASPFTSQQQERRPGPPAMPGF